MTAISQSDFKQQYTCPRCKREFVDNQRNAKQHFFCISQDKWSQTERRRVGKNKDELPSQDWVWERYKGGIVPFSSEGQKIPYRDLKVQIFSSSSPVKIEWIDPSSEESTPTSLDLSAEEPKKAPCPCVIL